MIQEAAATANIPKERIATHSLRIGGASALFDAGFSVALIQRWGGWASDAFQAYLWESSEDARGTCRSMTETRTFFARLGRRKSRHGSRWESRKARMSAVA